MSMRRVVVGLGLALAAFASGAPARADEAVGESLFNGRDLSGWRVTLGSSAAPADRDPASVFTVVEVDGEPTIRVSGQGVGGLSTEREFENYHLSLEFKWGEGRHPPRENLPRDSGLLYHTTGEANSGSGWLESVEFGILEGGETGDFWSVPGTQGVRVIVDLEAEEIPPEDRRYPEQVLRYRRGAPKRVGIADGLLNGDDNELPPGQWNRLDLYCLGSRGIHVVNGTVNLDLTNIRRLIDGREVPLTKGGVQLQSEGAEVFYRHIRVRPIDGLPEDVEKALTQPPLNTLTDDERQSGWQLLFDGQSLAGWRGYRQDETPAGWQAREGAIMRVEKAGDLITTDKFGSFDFTFDWKISPGGNSGVFYRATESGKAMYETGPEYEIRDNAYWLDDVWKTAANYGLHAYDGSAARPIGYWNQGRIVVRGRAVEHWLNGQQVVAYEFDSPDWKKRVSESKYHDWSDYARAAVGHIGIQDHESPVWYRNLKIRLLDE